MQPSCVTSLTVFLLLFTASSFAADNQLSSAEKEEGWLLLFDGKTFDGWMTSDRTPSERSIEDGTINPHRCGAYMIVHNRKWNNFVLKLDFKQAPELTFGLKT